MILLFVNGSDDNFILRAQSYQNVYFPIRNIPQQHVIITFTRCINHFLSKFYFIFLQTSLLNNSISLSFEPWIFYQRPYCFLSFLYFFLLSIRWRLWHAMGYTLQNKQYMEYFLWILLSVCLKKLVLRARTISSLWMIHRN